MVQRARSARSARDVACRVLRRVIHEQAFANLTLAGELDACGLDARDRRLATELVYGVCRHLTRIDRALAAKTRHGLGKVKPAVLAILRVGAYQLLFLDRVPDHAAVSEAVAAARDLGGARLAAFANSILRRLTREGEPSLPDADDVCRYIEVAHSLPGWIAGRLASQLGDPADSLHAAKALSKPAGLAIRGNFARITGHGVADQRSRQGMRSGVPTEQSGRPAGYSIGGDSQPDQPLAALRELLRGESPDAEIRASPFCPGALIVAGLGDPERSPSFRDGLWTVQDVAAQLVSRLVAAVGEPLRILDACAGVGGKTTHLAELHGDHAVIDAADRSPNKLALLDRNARRLGVEERIACHAIDLVAAGATGAEQLGHSYDAVVLDAPCTGLGVLRRHPETKWRVGESDVSRMAAVQRELLDAVCTRVRSGGVLVYSVCTFTAEEGQDQIASFLDRHPEFSLAPPPAQGDEGGTDSESVPWADLCPEPGIMITWPHRHGADGFFAARMVRK